MADAILSYAEAVVIWDLGGSPLVIGTSEIPTKGGSTASYSEEFWGPTFDQWGNTPVGQVKVGESATATVNIAGFNLDLFAGLFPDAEKTVEDEKVVVRFGGKIGEALYDNAKTLTFRPKHLFDAEDGDLGEADQDVTFLKALPRPNMEIAYAPQTTQVYAVEFVGLVDRSKGEIVVFGDAAATGS